MEKAEVICPACNKAHTNFYWDEHLRRKDVCPFCKQENTDTESNPQLKVRRTAVKGQSILTDDTGLGGLSIQLPTEYAELFAAAPTMEKAMKRIEEIVSVIEFTPSVDRDWLLEVLKAPVIMDAIKKVRS